MTELEKRVEWLEMQMRLVHRTLDKIDHKTEPQTSGYPYEIETTSVCKTEPQYILREPTEEEKQAILDCVEIEPQTDCSWK